MPDSVRSPQTSPLQSDETPQAVVPSVQAPSPTGTVRDLDVAFDRIVKGIEKDPVCFDLGIVIPMYGESRRIDRTIAALKNSPLQGTRIGYLFVDDGSKDKSGDAAEKAIAAHQLPNAQVLRLDRNLGKGGAVRAGVLELAQKSAWVAYLDADLSLNPADVAVAFSRMRTMRLDLLVGDRVVDPNVQPLVRRIASLAFRSVAASVVPTGVRDTQCAMKIFRSDVAKNLFENLSTPGFAFDVEVLGRARRFAYRVGEVPIEWEHQRGSSVNTVTDSVRMFKELLAVRREVRKG